MQQENRKISPIHNKCKYFHIITQTAKRQAAKFQVLPFAVRVNVGKIAIILMLFFIDLVILHLLFCSYHD